MNRSPVYKNFLWLLTITGIAAYYIIISSKIDSLLTDNKILQDSLRSLQRELKSLDSSLTNAVLLSENINVSIRDTIVNRTGDSVTVKFSPDTLVPGKYLWDFGDGMKSEETVPLHNYNTKKGNEFTVKLTVVFKGLTFISSKKIVLPVEQDTARIDASFDTLTIKKDLNKIIMQFSARERYADTYEWNLGNNKSAKTRETKQSFEFTGSAKYRVTLKITKKGRFANSSKELEFKVNPKINVSVSLEKKEFCKDENKLYKFTLIPPGGILSGADFMNKGNDYYFNPSGKDVKAGVVTFNYNVSGSKASYTITVHNKTDIDASFTVEESKKLDTNKRSKTILTIIATEKNGESYVWTINKKKQNSTKRKIQYELPEAYLYALQKLKLHINLTVKKYGCENSSEKEWSWK